MAEQVNRSMDLLPQLRLYQTIMNQASTEFYRQHYTESLPIFQEARQIATEGQNEIHRGLHKGDVFFNLGLAHLGSGNPQEAVWNILLAYVEDTLLPAFDFEDEADRSPAARTLIDGFTIQLRLLREIKRVSQRIKANRESWLTCMDPELILVEAISSLSADANIIQQLLGRQDLGLGPTPLGFPQPRDRRVFIGTNFDERAGVIPEMKLAIISRGYVPVSPRDVIMPPTENARSVSFVLLHTCRWAFIEITDPAGQLLELERARDYDIHVFLLRSRPIGHEPHFSSMIESHQYPIITYRDMDDLRRIIMERLP